MKQETPLGDAQNEIPERAAPTPTRDLQHNKAGDFRTRSEAIADQFRNVPITRNHARYQPSQEEEDKAESMMTEWQTLSSREREAFYTSLSEQEQHAYKEMLEKGDAIVHALRERGLMDKSLTETLGNYRDNRERIKNGEPISTPALDAVRDLYKSRGWGIGDSRAHGE